MNLRELAGVIERNDRGKQDLEVRSSEIRVSDDGVLIVDGKRMRPNYWMVSPRRQGGGLFRRPGLLLDGN